MPAEHATTSSGESPSATDTTELQRLRAELETQLEANRHLREELDLRDRAMDAAPSHFMICKYRPDADSIIVYINRRQAASHGYTPQELIGKSVKMVSTAGRSRERRQRERELLESGKELRFEEEVKRRDGSTFWAGVTVVPVLDADGRLTHIMSVASDITTRMEAERKKRELQDQLIQQMQERERILLELRLAQKLESVGRLAAGMAHEINTPIQYVGDSVHFLKDAFGDIRNLLSQYRSAAAEAPTAQSDALRSADAACAAADLEFLEAEIPKAFERTFDGVERVSHIVRAMKEFSHPDVTAFSPADLNHALQTTLIVATNEYKYCAQVKTQFADLPPVLCNIGELNQVFLNLIVNAAHAIQDSGKDTSNGEIFIGTAMTADRIEITIGDNGCGIARENLEKIYDPFFTTKEVGRGTGQGLAIAHSIVVDKHKGSIRVVSRPGEGTRFTITLPIARP